METECGIKDCPNMVEVGDDYDDEHTTVYCSQACWDRQQIESL